jgi:putative transposase
MSLGEWCLLGVGCISRRSMPRQTRIQLPGAVYHCSARGYQRRNIVLDDRDRHAHERAVAELVQRTGWEIYAWVLLDDHYHLVLKTPEANLVAGMKWFQNFWTKRFNAHHARRGPVFGGRYRSVMVQEGEHLSTLIDHVHLNAYRSGLVDLSRLAAHRWSSLRDYLLEPSSRRPWLRVAEGYSRMGYDGADSGDRLLYLERLEAVAALWGGRPVLPDPGRTLHSTLRRGWYLGEESFRDKLLALRSGGAGWGKESGDHGPEMAQRLLRAGLSFCGLSYECLEGLRRSDWRKRAIGRAIRRRTTVSTEWIASNLEMGVSSRAAFLVARDPESGWGRSWQAALELFKQLMSLPDCAPTTRNSEEECRCDEGADRCECEVTR